MEDFIKNLNEKQKEAVLHKDGPLLIIAGAGAGKTKTIAHRIANLINSGVNPRSILAVTFTNKAAKEMNDRVRFLFSFNRSFETPFVSTFHSLGVHILKENAEALGRSKYFSILDDNDSMSFLKRSAKSFGLDPKEINIRAIKNTISSCKNKMMEISKLKEEKDGGNFKSMTANIWTKYEEMLKENEAYDFDDLVLKTVKLFQERKDILDFYQGLWKYIHIDEYQDTNTVQYELSKLLAEKHGNICVVGDSDQAIYSWRSADFRNILNFENNFPGAKVVLLEQNYRSTKTILSLANRVIQRNKFRKDKNLFTKNEEGQKATLFEGIDEVSEANFITKKSKELINKGVSPKDIAVLYRANFQSRIIEENFLREGLPYQILGTRFYERKEIKDMISFIKFALNKKDKESLSRIINVPPRGIGKVTLEKIYDGKENELPQKTKEKLFLFHRKIDKVKEALLSKRLPEAIKFIIKEMCLDTFYKDDGKEEGLDRLENILELASIASKYDSLDIESALDKFITDTSLMSDQDSIIDKKNKDGVRLMTIHASKGLEFKYVFITGLEQDLFPHRGFGDGELRDPEEERRLFYVAVTRAKEKLFLSYAASRMVYGQRKMNLPSEFLEDMDETVAEVEKGFGFDNFKDRGYNNSELKNDIIWDCLN